MGLFKEIVLPAVGLVFQHAQFMQFLGIDVGALRDDGEVDFGVSDDFFHQWQRQLGLLYADDDGALGCWLLIGFKERIQTALEAGNQT